MELTQKGLENSIGVMSETLKVLTEKKKEF